MTERTVPPARVVFTPEDRREILELVDAALETGSLTLGPLTRELEAAFSVAHGERGSVATSSGTSALEIIVRALCIEGPVVVPANTFYATAGAVLHAGCRPVFADIDPATLALSAATVEEAVTPDTAAVVHVHIGGVISPGIAEIRALCDERGIELIEDAAHAHGSTLNGMPAGTWSHASGFSFYPTKVVASAEGGMIVSEDERVLDEARIYRDQGKASFLEGGHVRLGSAWRMSEVQAAIALVHLRRLQEFIEVRRGVARRYDRALSELGGIELLAEPAGARGNYYKYPVLLAGGIDRAEFKKVAREEHGVFMSGEVYATPLHLEPVLSRFRDRPLPVAEDVCARQVCLPVHSDMADNEVDRVIEAVAGTIGRLAPS